MQQNFELQLCSSQTTSQLFLLLFFKVSQAGIKVRFARVSFQPLNIRGSAALAFQAHLSFKLFLWNNEASAWRISRCLALTPTDIFPLMRWFKRQLILLVFCFSCVVVNVDLKSRESDVQDVRSHRHHLQAAAAAWHLWTVVPEEGRGRKDYEAHINGENSDWINTHLTILTADSLSCAGWERTAEPAGLAVQTWQSL